MGRAQPGNPQHDGPTQREARRRPHHATVVAWLALFIALGGVATGLPGNNTVGPKDIRNGAVHGPDIHRNAVRSSDLRNGAVSADDLAAGAVGTPQLLDGAVTPGKIGGVPAARVDSPAQAPGCADQVVESGQTETVEFSLELFDEQAMHTDPPGDCSPAMQSRLAAPIDGIYTVTAAVGWSSNDNGDRTIELVRTNVGGPTGVGADTRPAVTGGGMDQSVATIINLEGGDYVEARVTQDSGSPLTLGNSIDTYLAMAWVGPPPP
jgi:hypothetical protein